MQKGKSSGRVESQVVRVAVYLMLKEKWPEVRADRDSWAVATGLDVWSGA